MERNTINLPVLALRGLTVFPGANLSFDVERRASARALEYAMEADQEICLISQREVGVEKPNREDLYEMGTVSHVSQILRVGPNSLRVMVEGGRRAKLKRLWQTEPYLQGQVEIIEETPAEANGPRTEALMRQTRNLLGTYASLVNNLADEIVTRALDCRDPGRLADFIAQNVALQTEEKQTILEELSPYLRLRKLNGFLARECDVLGYEHQIEDKVREEIGRGQREQILRTQIRVLQEELGEDEEDEIAEYRAKIDALKLTDEVATHLKKEVDRLAKQPYSGAESAVIRNYLDVCLEIPWNVYTKERLDIDAARRILDRDHYGLDKVKSRIVETLAVRRMNPEGKGQILCLVGPPGVGKTSVAVSVAKALRRKLVRISLGGVRDEADIRGHRKTYIGAMPGRIVEAIAHSGSMNPLIVLDEIDKLGRDYHGDPASALLEVLDGEQNIAFRDHFLELPLDLS
ncbi:MAG: LON peptidase substrate-binding domain-containing protein, partial [Oscillibacter sp.]|nr:LON peptidase substrate-binding domain-containing protein [Oscillibacter sp.]